MTPTTMTSQLVLPASTHAPFQTDRHTDELTTFFADLARRENRTPYFVTVTYTDSVDHPLTAASANTQLKEFHQCLLNHLCSNIQRPCFRKIEPIVFAFLDVPSKARLATRLSTFHHHCIVLVSEQHVERFDALTDDHAAEALVFQSRLRCRIRTLNVQRIGSSDDDLERSVSYATKYYRRDVSDLNRLRLYPASTAKFVDRVCP
jgi:hypothetical protein